MSVRSVDADGCVFNEKFFASQADDRLIVANERLLAAISSEISDEKYDGIVWMVGSNRQSSEADIENSGWGKGSFYPVLQTLCDEVNKRVPHWPSRVDGYLLADTYGDKPAGENFAQSIAEAQYDFSKWLFDKTKLTILYAQMHKIASENPQAAIDFDFYDDVNEPILQGLKRFFAANPDLIPRNVKLRLHRYNGNELEKIAEQQGTGDIDANYQNNIKLMATCAGYSYEKGSKDYGDELFFLTKLTDNENAGLERFKKERRLTAGLPLAAPTPQRPTRKPGFFKRHWKKILVGALIGLAVIGIAAFCIFTFGAGAAVVGGIMIATGLSAGGAIAAGATTAAAVGIGVGAAVGASAGIRSDRRAAAKVATEQAPLLADDQSDSDTPTPAVIPGAQEQAVARIRDVLSSTALVNESLAATPGSVNSPSQSPTLLPPSSAILDSDTVDQIRDWALSQDTHHKGSIAVACIRVASAMKTQQPFDDQQVDRQVVQIVHRYQQQPSPNLRAMEEELDRLWLRPEIVLALREAPRSYAGSGIVARP